MYDWTLDFSFKLYFILFRFFCYFINYYLSIHIFFRMFCIYVIKVFWFNNFQSFIRSIL